MSGWQCVFPPKCPGKPILCLFMHKKFLTNEPFYATLKW
jgi:hypothetical protein